MNDLWLLLIKVAGLVLSLGVAHPEAGGTGLNEPVLLGRGQNGETQRGKTVSGAGYASLCIVRRKNHGYEAGCDKLS